LFEAAHESTLFLDEVGELPLPMQAKLLRVLETGEVQRLGSLRTRQVDVRLVAATNRDLGAAIAAGTFRLDLFYRLNGISLSIPPLRERREDIVALADHFASALMREEGPLFTPEARAALEAYAWPGNVRELKSTIQRAALLAQGAVIDAAQIVLAPAPWLALGVDAPGPAILPLVTVPPADSSVRSAGPESGPSPTARRSGMTMPSAPTASAVRITAPKLCGSSMPSSTTMKALLPRRFSKSAARSS
jgi:transcriptional regulator with GAF, ATPase, and Fis domain